MKNAVKIVLAAVVDWRYSFRDIRGEKPPFSGFLGNPSAYDLLKPSPDAIPLSETRDRFQEIQQFMWTVLFSFWPTMQTTRH